MSIIEKVTKVVEANSDLLDFRTPNDKHGLIDAIAGKLDMAGETIVIKGRNTKANIENMVHQHKGPFVKTQSIGRYYPKFSDDRPAEVKEKEAGENFKLLMDYVEKSGTVFGNAEEGQKALATIARNFIIENDEGKNTVLRKRYKGMFSVAHNIDTVLQKYVTSVDAEETHFKEMELKAAHRKKAADLLGLSYKSTITDKDREHLDEMTQKLWQRSKRTNLGQKVTRRPVNEYEQAIKARVLHTWGVEDPDKLTFHRRVRWDNSAKGEIAALDDLTTFDDE